MVPRLDQGRNSRQSSEVAESLFGPPDCSPGYAPILGMVILNVPAFLPELRTKAENLAVCNEYGMQNLELVQKVLHLVRPKVCE
jgi:hypothetical protein